MFRVHRQSFLKGDNLCYVLFDFLATTLEKVKGPTITDKGQEFIQSGTISHPCILVDYSAVICWTSPFVILGVSGIFFRFYSRDA